MAFLYSNDAKVGSEEKECGFKPTDRFECQAESFGVGDVAAVFVVVNPADRSGIDFLRTYSILRSICSTRYLFSSSD